VRTTFFAAALATAVTIGSTCGGAAESTSPPAQTAMPAAAESGAGDEAAQPMPGRPGGMDHGPMMGHMMMRHMMMRHMMMGRHDPKERCIDRLAWRAARRAYVEAKLDLTAAQRPLWDKVQSAAQAEEQKERQLCNALKAGEPGSLLDRMDRMQQFLSARLEGLEAAKPALQSLYQALTPEQRAIIDHPFRS
jgi:hypothetical protein